MFDKQLIRCSGLGKVMTNNRKGDAMGETAKSYLKELYLRVKFGIQKDVTSKYISKGLMVEESAISLLSNVYGEFHTKNDEFKANDYICGTCDIYENGIIRDIRLIRNIGHDIADRLGNILGIGFKNCLHLLVW